jgi:hypothetical protein
MIRVRSNPEQVATYRRLLTSDWKSQLTEEVLQLLWSMIGGRPASDDVELLPLLDPQSNGAFSTAEFAVVLPRIAEATKLLLSRVDLPELPAEYSLTKRPSKLVRQSIHLSTYLTLQAHATVSGDANFFMDVQSLAFQAAIHFALPGLRDRHPVEHSILLHAAALFPYEYLAFDQSHFCYMISMVYDYLGNFDRRLKFLHDSFRLTPRDDHSYLTKAQEYWSELLDHGRRPEAEEFLFSLHWRSPESQHDEVRQMITAAFEYGMAGNDG